MRVTFTATIDTTRRVGGSKVRARRRRQTLGLTVLRRPRRLLLKARGGNVAPGCNDAGPGVADPEEGRRLRLRRPHGLREEAEGAAAEFKDETQVTISANPAIPYQ